VIAIATDVSPGRIHVLTIGTSASFLGDVCGITVIPWSGANVVVRS
jgi:hypothetical protein